MISHPGISEHDRLCPDMSDCVQYYIVHSEEEEDIKQVVSLCHHHEPYLDLIMSHTHLVALKWQYSDTTDITNIPRSSQLSRMQKCYSSTANKDCFFIALPFVSVLPTSNLTMVLFDTPRWRNEQICMQIYTICGKYFHLVTHQLLTCWRR